MRTHTAPASGKATALAHPLRLTLLDRVLAKADGWLQAAPKPRAKRKARRKAKQLPDGCTHVCKFPVTPRSHLAAAEYFRIPGALRRGSIVLLAKKYRISGPAVSQAIARKLAEANRQEESVRSA